MTSNPKTSDWHRRVTAFSLIAGFVLYSSALLGASPSPRSGPAQDFLVEKLQLPAAQGLVVLDYFAYEPVHARIWVPAGNLGAVAVIDAATDRITMVNGFRTGEVELLGKKRVLGPSSVSIGEGVVYIGNRGDSNICVVDAASLTLLDCQPVGDPAAGLAAAPDAVVYVAPTKELWVTTGAPPLGIAAADRSLLILDASDPRYLKPKRKLALGGSAEGYAVDGKRGLFYTSLEERAETVAIDVRRKTIVSRWRSGCEEPHGIALDAARRFLFVACADRVVALDAGRGRVLGTITTGAGLDNIDYSPSGQTLYAAASEAATLTIARVGARGGLNRIATIPTVKGARSVIAGGPSTAYLIDPFGGSILKVKPR